VQEVKERKRNLNYIVPQEVILKGHFSLGSGKHTNIFFNKNLFYANPEMVCDVSLKIASKIRNTKAIEAVVGPGMGGAILSQWVAYYLRSTRVESVISIFAEKKDELWFLKKDFRKMINGKKVLVVDDIINTGRTVKGIVETVENAGGKVVMVFVVLDRRGRKSELAAPVGSLFMKTCGSWDSNNCFLCSVGIKFGN